MDNMITLLENTALQVWITLQHNWPFLVVSILIAVMLKLYVNPQKVSAFLIRHQRIGVIGATAAAVGTPLCSCGTTAVILGMMAGMLPWAPIVAFMVASPLTSPEELVYSAGLFGWPFAIAFFGASILLGLFAGLVAGILDKRGWLKNQARYNLQDAKIKTQPAAPSLSAVSVEECGSTRDQPGACSCEDNMMRAVPVAGEYSQRRFAINAKPYSILPDQHSLALETCGCGGVAAERMESKVSVEKQPVKQVSRLDGKEQMHGRDVNVRVTPQRFLGEVLQTAKYLLLMFLGFAFIGYFLNSLIPPAWVSAVFGKGNIFSVPLAATLGLPLYINTEASLPLVRALIDGGMSQGAALAFLITGAGTSVGAVAGALTIARWRVIGLVVGILWLGAVGLGYLYNLLLLYFPF